MKFSSLFQVTSLISLFQATQAQAGIEWIISKTPSTGLKDITFPISLQNAPHEQGWFFAQQFKFNGRYQRINDVGYAGLQPLKDSGSSPVIRAVFASFIDGTTTNDKNCAELVDGRQGISCSVDIKATYSNKQLIQIHNTDGTTWVATLIDSVTKARSPIGSWKLPDGAEGIQGSEIGFAEYYPLSNGDHKTCSQIPKTEVVFGNPYNFQDGLMGIVSRPYQIGECYGTSNFQTVKTDDGYKITDGF
ncbi:hypothetical protein N7456_000273 [Penicillium angulare]|uniref:Secreted protein n=1 Tax=Penicillium angulare TaxID=116970 RepID=A0A9W9KRZ3_9EURO|nr:hypothetical protein N7456_000273 [Penicillium angulare]